VKIDRSFVRGVAENRADRAIVDDFTQLARSLGRQVLATGVETEAQRDTLQAIGCDLMQGYLFGRPLPPERFARVLSSWARARGLGHAA
jgi:EAL domain-containing protein (putative c-di-GMP-specific phosphodiesterase class I)